MAAGVRLRSRWGVATLVCLIMVYHLDLGEGLPLRGEAEVEGHLELLEEGSSESVLEELAQAERIGSGEAAYDAEQKDTQLSVPQIATFSKPPTVQAMDEVGNAAQVDLLASLDSAAQIHRQHANAEVVEQTTNDMFADALRKWDVDKKSVADKESDKDALLTTDLSNRVENDNEESSIALGSFSVPFGRTKPDTGVASQAQPLLTLEAAPAAVPDLWAQFAKETAGVSSQEPPLQTLEAAPAATPDPLAQFAQEFSTRLDDADAAQTGQSAKSAEKLSATPLAVSELVNVGHVTQKVDSQSAQATTQAASGGTDDRHDWMTKALAQWGSESEASLSPNPDAPDARIASLTTNTVDEHGDLGESDEVDSTAATVQKNLSSDIEAEAQQAASEVVKDTMEAVERDFLYTEKAITHKLGEGQKPLTLEDLQNAGGKTQAEKVTQKAQKSHKEMVQKAQMNYDYAIANVHKNTQTQLANELAGLKKQLTVSEASILSETKLQQQTAKADMENTVRLRTAQLVEEMKATLPKKLAVLRQQAEVQAQRVASVAIEMITQGARKVRMRLRDDLGEAAGRVRSAESNLAASDKNPSMALKAAVDVRTEKAQYSRLHDLAESALVQQKSQASEKIVKAENNAKESVKLAVKDAEQKELKDAQGKLATSQQQLEREEQSKLEQKNKMIEAAGQARIQAERKKFKTLVDAAVKMAPGREEAFRKKAQVALQKAKVAAQAYEEKMISTLAPHTADGKTVTKEMAAECIKNPAGCAMFTLKNQNIDAATKFAESKARQAKREQEEAKEGVAKALEKLRATTTAADKAAEEARSMDDKLTRIKLAKLQLNEAKAAAAFHSAAKAHLQSQLVNTDIKSVEESANSKMKDFENALKQMKITASEKTIDDAEKAKLAKKAAFAKAREAAKALLEMQPSYTQDLLV